MIPKQELLLKSRATYPPTFHPGQQSTGPLVSQRSLNWGAERRCVDSTVHMDRMEEWVNRSSEGLQVKDKKDHLATNKKLKIARVLEQTRKLSLIPLFHNRAVNYPVGFS